MVAFSLMDLRTLSVVHTCVSSKQVTFTKKWTGSLFAQAWLSRLSQFAISILASFVKIHGVHMRKFSLKQ